MLSYLIKNKNSFQEQPRLLAKKARDAAIADPSV